MVGLGWNGSDGQSSAWAMVVSSVADERNTQEVSTRGYRQGDQSMDEGIRIGLGDGLAVKSTQLEGHYWLAEWTSARRGVETSLGG